ERPAAELSGHHRGADPDDRRCPHPAVSREAILLTVTCKCIYLDANALKPLELAMAAQLRLISHKLCPYVQRAVIALTEKGVAFERIDIDLANKPDWFVPISPLGKTPVLQVGAVPIFESAVILEYL